MFHFRHHWKTVGVDNNLVRVTFRVGMLSGITPVDRRGAPITEAMQRCNDCGKLRTVTFDGTWTLEQLQ